MNNENGQRDNGLTSSIVPMLNAIGESKSSRRWAGFQRVVFYVAGGALSLLFLISLTRQITPPDSALENGPMTQVLGHWDGEWTGSEVRLTLTGEKTAQFETVRSYWSTSATHQTSSVMRSRIAGETSSEVWLNRVDQDGRLQARRGLGDDSPALFKGRLEKECLIWSRETEQSSEMIRCWLEGSTLRVEELCVSRLNPGESYLLSGRYTRTAAAGDTK